MFNVKIDVGISEISEQMNDSVYVRFFKPYLELTRVRFPRKALFANSGCEELVRPC